MADALGVSLNARHDPAAHAPVPEALQRAAEEFEAMVLSQLLQPMFAALDTEGLGGGGLGEEIFRPMLVEHYAAGLARSSGIGLAESIVAELQRMQAAPSAPEGSDGVDR